MAAAATAAAVAVAVAAIGRQALGVKGPCKLSQSSSQRWVGHWLFVLVLTCIHLLLRLLVMCCTSRSLMCALAGPFITQGYREGLWFWEPVQLLQTLSLVAMASLGLTLPGLQQVGRRAAAEGV